MAYHQLLDSESWFSKALSSDSANNMKPQLSVSLALQAVETGTFVWKPSNSSLSVNLDHCHCPALQRKRIAPQALLFSDSMLCNCGHHCFKNFSSRSSVSNSVSLFTIDTLEH